MEKRNAEMADVTGQDRNAVFSEYMKKILRMEPDEIIIPSASGAGNQEILAAKA